MGNNYEGKDTTTYCGMITSLNPAIFKQNLTDLIRPDTMVFQELEECIFNRK